MLIVLDMDDTLYLERDYVRSGFRAVDRWLFEKTGLKGFFADAWTLFERGVRGTVFNQALGLRGAYEEKMIPEMVQVYRSHAPDIHLSADAKAFLENNAGSMPALITDGPSLSQWAKINALNLKKYIPHIIVTDDLGPEWSKPNLRAFQKIQGKLDPAGCCYVADNPRKDFQGPLALGWGLCVRIRREGSLHFDLPTPEGCVEISSFDGLAGYMPR